MQEKDTLVTAWCGESLTVNWQAMETGCGTSPTKTSDTAKLHSKIVHDERSEGVLNTAAGTKVLPIMDISINGAFKTHFMMIIISGLRLRSAVSIAWIMNVFSVDLSLLVIFTRPLKLFERLVKLLDTFWTARMIIPRLLDIALTYHWRKVLLDL